MNEKIQLLQTYENEGTLVTDMIFITNEGIQVHITHKSKSEVDNLKAIINYLVK